MDIGPLNEDLVKRELSDREYYVFQTLLIDDYTGQLSAIYYGALKSVQQLENPEHLVNSAHNCRELMDQLPRYRKSLPFPDREISLKSKVMELRAVWERLRKGASYNREIDKWSGKIGTELKSFLHEVDRFFIWQKDNRPSRKDQAKEVRKRGRVAQVPMPEQMDEPRMKLWVELRGYFDKASHHNIASLLEDDLNEKRRMLEDLILDALRSDTVPQLDTVDAIIEEGERNGD